jgi:hypothetical protein
LPKKNIEKKIKKNYLINIKNGMKKIRKSGMNIKKNGEKRIVINYERPNVITKELVKLMTPSIS